MVTMVMIVMVIDTQGSLQINLASLFPGILKTLSACMEGILWRVKAATSVFSFLCLQAKYTCQAIKATTMHVVVR